MVNPRVEKAVKVTLDFCNHITTPSCWPIIARRIYVLTFPVSMPVLVVVNVFVIATAVMLVAVLFAISGFLKLFEYLKKMWVTGDNA